MRDALPQHRSLLQQTQGQAQHQGQLASRLVREPPGTGATQRHLRRWHAEIISHSTTTTTTTTTTANAARISINVKMLRIVTYRGTDFWHQSVTPIGHFRLFVHQ